MNKEKNQNEIICEISLMICCTTPYRYRNSKEKMRLNKNNFQQNYELNVKLRIIHTSHTKLKLKKKRKNNLLDINKIKC